MTTTPKSFDDQIFSNDHLSDYLEICKNESLDLKNLNSIQQNLISQAFTLMTPEEIAGKNVNLFTRLILSYNFSKNIYFIMNKNSALKIVISTINNHAKSYFESKIINRIENENIDNSLKKDILDKVNNYAIEKKFLLSKKSIDDIKKYYILDEISIFKEKFLFSKNILDSLQNKITNVGELLINANEILIHGNDLAEIKKEFDKLYEDDEISNKLMNNLMNSLQNEDGKIHYDENQINIKKNELIDRQNKQLLNKYFNSVKHELSEIYHNNDAKVDVIMKDFKNYLSDDGKIQYDEKLLQFKKSELIKYHTYSKEYFDTVKNELKGIFPDNNEVIFIMSQLNNFVQDQKIDILSDSSLVTDKKNQLIKSYQKERVFKGTQEDCDGEVCKKKVEQIRQILQNQNNEVISFNKNKVCSSIEGGTCTAMSLEFTDSYFKIKKDLENSSNNDPELLIKSLANLGPKFVKSSEIMRIQQAAFNTIEVNEDENETNYSKQKVMSLVNYREFDIKYSSEELDVVDIQSKDQIDSEIDSLPEGIYFVRLLKPSDNVKLEEHGHSMIYIKEKEGFNIFYDPNFGCKNFDNLDRTKEALFENFQFNFQKFGTSKLAFYQLEQREPTQE